MMSDTTNVVYCDICGEEIRSHDREAVRLAYEKININDVVPVNVRHVCGTCMYNAELAEIWKKPKGSENNNG